jgi:hypothetical protein
MSGESESTNEDVKDESQGDESAEQQEEREEVRDPEAVLAKNRELLDKLAAASTKLEEFEKAAEERRKAEMSEAERAIEEARKAGYEEAASVLGKQLLQERIIARSAGVLQDPTDAVALIDVSELDIDDTDAIDKAIAELVKAKPHLKVSGRRSGPTQGPHGSPAPADNADDWLRGVLGR